MVDICIRRNWRAGHYLANNKFPGNKNSVDEPGEKFKNRVEEAVSNWPLAVSYKRFIFVSLIANG
jgi:hypothetical protein